MDDDFYVVKVEKGVGTWLVTGKKEIELFRKDKFGHFKKADHLTLKSKWIPNPSTEFLVDFSRFLY